MRATLLVTRNATRWNFSLSTLNQCAIPTLSVKKKSSVCCSPKPGARAGHRMDQRDNRINDYSGILYFDSKQNVLSPFGKWKRFFNQVSLKLFQSFTNAAVRRSIWSEAPANNKQTPIHDVFFTVKEDTHV